MMDETKCLYRACSCKVREKTYCSECSEECANAEKARAGGSGSCPCQHPGCKAGH